MGEGGPERRVPEAAEAQDDEFSISRSNALAPILVLFTATLIGILAIVVRAKPYLPSVGAAADRAYGPADFPKVFGRDEALVGLSRPSDATGAAGATQFPVPAPPFSEGMFPCMECHAELTPNPKRRQLKMAHDEIEFRHDAEHRWCLDCHDAKDRDHLRLASGALVEFTESYKLCGQCHGPQFRDWRAGIHGKRTGYWDGPKRYLLCVHCHNPHRPRFPPMQPLPPPIRPQLLHAEEASHAR